MREIDELYADSGEPVKESRGVSRGTALKVGGLGLAGALAAFMPGRAGASVRRKASNASCQGMGFECVGSNKSKSCNLDPANDCFCATIYYPKLRPAGAPVGACIQNGDCPDPFPEDCPTDDIVIGPNGFCNQQKQCGPGYVCISESCCTPGVSCSGVVYKGVCAHYCQQGSQSAPPLTAAGTFAHK